MGNSIRDKNIVLGVCGGIAAYKSVELLRLLVKEGANVRGPTNHCAFCVIIILTFAPAFTRSRKSSTLLYAAIPPQTPSTIFFSLILFSIYSLSVTLDGFKTSQRSLLTILIEPISKTI